MSYVKIDEPFRHNPRTGYEFVPKGDVYITKNCRKLAHKAGRTVYVVQDSDGVTQGIGVPNFIYLQVLRLDAETKDARAAAVLKKDVALETKVKAEMLKLFPKVPEDEVRCILKHTLKKGSGRVGRNRELPLGGMVGLAVRAHIRHGHTNYDGMLRAGASRDRAREAIRGIVDEKIDAWGGKRPGSSGSSSSSSKRKPVQAKRLKIKSPSRLKSKAIKHKTSLKETTKSSMEGARTRSSRFILRKDRSATKK